VHISGIMASIPHNYPPSGIDPASQSKQPQAPSAPPVQPKRTRRNKNHSQSLPQIDGTVSDSVTNPMASAQSRKAPKQRHQSVAVGAVPKENGNVSRPNGAKARPVSVGASMLPATPVKEQAYAGPTFQASPAPSSLPVPKFFSRSVPNVAAQKQSLEARMAGENTPEAERSSPEAEVVAPPPRDANLSPLDVFFRADQAERKQSRGGSVQSPEMVAKRAVPATEPRNAFQHTGKSVFLRELDGETDMPSPKTVPRNDRPVLPQRSTSSGNHSPLAPGSGDREEYTKSLKDLLFNVNASPPPAQPYNGTPRRNSNSQDANSPFQTPSPFQRSTSGPSTPAPSIEQQNHYSLHYGNRNLSPLFTAARNDTPPARPSGLRQQQLSSELSPASPNNNSAFPPPQLDPDSFSRSYLNQHIRASQPATMPPLPLSNGTNSASAPSSRDGAPATSASPRTGSGSGSSQDIRTMEDDLRRMLKLNVLSN